MVFRMYEYLFMAGRELAYQTHSLLKVTLPNAGLLYLRSNRAIPGHMSIQLQADEVVFAIPVRILKLEDYDLEDIFNLVLL